MNAPLYLYKVNFSCNAEIIIAAVNLQAAVDHAKDELLKLSDAADMSRIKRSQLISVKQIHGDVHFAIAGGAE